VPSDLDSPYMLLVAPVKRTKSDVRSLRRRLGRPVIAKLKAHRRISKAVTHVDFSAGFRPSMLSVTGFTGD
jgi:hypothetical protein